MARIEITYIGAKGAPKIGFDFGTCHCIVVVPRSDSKFVPLPKIKGDDESILRTFCEAALAERPTLIKQAQKKWGWLFNGNLVEAEDVVDQAIVELHPDMSSKNYLDFVATPDLGRRLNRATNDVVIDHLRGRKRSAAYTERAKKSQPRCMRAIERAGSAGPKPEKARAAQPRRRSAGPTPKTSAQPRSRQRGRSQPRRAS